MELRAGIGRARGRQQIVTGGQGGPTGQHVSQVPSTFIPPLAAFELGICAKGQKKTTAVEKTGKFRRLNVTKARNKVFLSSLITRGLSSTYLSSAHWVSVCCGHLYSSV